MLLDRLARAAAADPDVAAVTPPALSPTGDAAVLTVLPNSSPQDQATTDLVTRLRQQIIPTARGDSGTQIYVGGLTATILDLASQVADRLPLFIGAVVGVSFLLLVVVFRALLVPLKAALLNLLSIGAAYGVVVAIFQWGWAKGLVGLETTVPIMSFVPMLMFAILFGLSMDYEVFLLSRIREEYVATGDAHGSVVTAIAATARVITSAALIMVCVFVGFVFSSDPVLKMVGVGLAVAVAIDATIVRVVLVPALMSLLGDRAWWLPRWLDRTLPSVNLEATTPAPTTAPPNTHPGHAASSPTGTGTSVPALIDSAVNVSEVAVDRSPADPKSLGNGGHAVLPRAIHLLGHLELVGGQTEGRRHGGRGPGGASPALVRSRIRSRSNSARAANTWKTSLPPGVVVSIASWRLRKPIPRSARPVTVSTRWRSERPNRSSFHTTRVSPGRSWSKSCSRTGRSARAPLAVSVNTR